MRRPAVCLGIPWIRVVVYALCGWLWMPGSSLATQRGSWEIGLDLGAEFTSRTVEQPGFFGLGDSLDLREKVVDVPQGAFRVGYFFTDALSMESSLGLSWILQSPDTDVTDWEVRLGLGGTYALSTSSRFSPYLSSGVSARYSSRVRYDFYGFTSSDIVFGIPIEGGVRIRVGEVHSIRVQSGVVASFNPDPLNPGGLYWTVPVRIGWSVNTKAASGGTPQ